MAAASDVIVIGGGVIGLSLAWQLSRKGARVTLLERGEVGKESSRSAAGMLLPFGEAPARDPMFRLCLESLKLFPSFVRELEALTGLKVDLVASGALYPAWDASERAHFEKRFRWQGEFGLTHQALDRHQIRARYPGLSRDLKTAYLVGNDQQVDNRKLLAALLAACQAGSVSVEEGQEAREVRVRKGRTTGVKTARGTFKAPWVVNAAGAWASRIAYPGLGEQPEVVPIRGQRITLGPTETSRHYHPATTIFTHGCYLVPRADGSLILGATEEEDGFSKQVRPEGILLLLSKALRLFPALNYYSVRSLECGLRPAARDRRPLLGATSLKGYAMATGHYRNGILLAPITARCLSDLVLDGTTSPHLREFSPARSN